MTPYLSRRADRLEHRFPDVCPKCGESLPTRGDRRPHFERAHPSAIGRAVWNENTDFSREFVYIGPAYGESDRWVVMWLDWPIELVKMRHEQYVVTWRGAVPPEGESR